MLHLVSKAIHHCYGAIPQFAAYIKGAHVFAHKIAGINIEFVSTKEITIKRKTKEKPLI